MPEELAVRGPEPDRILQVIRQGHEGRRGPEAHGAEKRRNDFEERPVKDQHEIFRADADLSQLACA
ncbi:MAG: hypothetical protein RIM80_01165, partial [Alphaproteobacteria bacterium]